MSTGQPVSYAIYDAMKIEDLVSRHDAILTLIRKEQASAQAYELSLLTQTDAYKSKSFRKVALIVNTRIETLKEQS